MQTVSSNHSAITASKGIVTNANFTFDFLLYIVHLIQEEQSVVESPLISWGAVVNSELDEVIWARVSGVIKKSLNSEIFYGNQSI